jgi:hypothetical protein
VWREGRDVARALFASLRGQLPDATHHTMLVARSPIRYVCPQLLSHPATVPAALPVNIRVERKVHGRLRVVDDTNELWGGARRLLPERRVLAPLTAQMATDHARLTLDMAEAMAK